MRNWVALQDSYDCYYCVVDLHAITVRQDATALRKRCVETMTLLLACGLDPEKVTIFMQSHVSAHAELGWVLSCNAYMGELGRMTQFKEKSAQHSDNINAGLFTYPVLMAADILLYQTNLVPIGADQKQHLELSRDIAIRFNNAYGDTFATPEPYIPKVGARVMSLLEPEKKMSKSDDNENATIALLDPIDVIVKKIKRAVTDSQATITYDIENKTGVSNLLSIYSACSGKDVEVCVNELSGQGYGALKQAAADAVVAVIEPLQKRFGQIMADKAYLNSIMHQSTEKAAKTAARTLSKVYRKVGLAAREI